MGPRLRGWVLGALSFGTLLFAYLAWRLPGPGSELSAPVAAAGSSSIGQRLPELVLLDHEGRALTFGALRGRPVWLALFRDACGSDCRARLQALGARAPEIAAAGVQLLAVLPDAPALLAELRRELALPFPLLSDREQQATSALCDAARQCQLVVDPEGIVRWAGAAEAGNEALESSFEVARRLGQ